MQWACPCRLITVPAKTGGMPFHSASALFYNPDTPLVLTRFKYRDAVHFQHPTPTHRQASYNLHLQHPTPTHRQASYNLHLQHPTPKHRHATSCTHSTPHQHTGKQATSCTYSTPHQHTGKLQPARAQNTGKLQPLHVHKTQASYNLCTCTKYRQATTSARARCQRHPQFLPINLGAV